MTARSKSCSCDRSFAARCALVALAMLLVPACTPARRWTAPSEVGPEPAIVTDTGDLVVFSADDLVDTADADHPHHRRFTILTADGHELHTVTNQSGPFGQDPQSVALPPGHYLVDTSATNFGPVRVPVVVEQGRTTIVHLDGDDDSDPVPDAVAVRLPNGHPIGARSSVGP
jgi:hypothetical protein